MVLDALPQFLRATVKTPVYFAGLAGFAIALWRFPLRLVIPAVLFLTGVVHLRRHRARGAVGDRALPDGPLGDDVPVRGRRARRLHDGAARARGCGAAGRSAAVSRRRCSGSPTRRSIRPSLDALRRRAGLPRRRQPQPALDPARRPRFSRGLRCGAVSVPTHKLIPDARWILDVGEGGVVARSDPSPQPRSARRATASRCSRSAAATCSGPASRSTPRRRRRCRRPASGGSRPTATSPPTCAARPGVRRRFASAGQRSARLRCRRAGRSRSRPCWRGALALRLWGIKHGLPYVYNVDENANFVPTAVGFFSGDYNPHYFINPPAFSYLLHAVFAVWFGRRLAVRTRGAAVSDALRDRPDRRCSRVARVTSAVLGAGAVALVYATGARLYDRRVGLLAAAIMATAFLPVFYSHLALNDVPALFPLMLSVYGSAGVLVHGRRRDYLIAGAGLGPGGGDQVHRRRSSLLPLLAARPFACATRAAPARPCAGWPPAAALARAAFLVANPHALLSFSEFWADVASRRAPPATSASSGRPTTPAFVYYLWVLTWGVGWVPAIVAALGCRSSLRARPSDGPCSCVPWPLVFMLYHGTCRTATSGAGCCRRCRRSRCSPPFAAVIAIDRVRAGPRSGRLLVGARGLLLAARASSTAFTSIACCRATTRATSRAPGWCDNVPPGSKIVVEPIVPDAWTTDAGQAAADARAAAGAGRSSSPRAPRSTSRGASGAATSGARSRSRTTSASRGRR